MSAEESEVVPRRIKIKPKPKQWAEAEALWATGEATLAELSKMLGISMSGISIHMKKRGIANKSAAEEHKRKVTEKVIEAVSEDAGIIAARIRETKEDHYKMATGLAKLAWNEVLKTQQAKEPISTATSNLKALEAAANVLSKLRLERWAILGLDRADTFSPDELPELVISELTAEQIHALQERNFNELDIEESSDLTDEELEELDQDLDDEG